MLQQNQCESYDIKNDMNTPMITKKTVNPIEL